MYAKDELHKASILELELMYNSLITKREEVSKEAFALIETEDENLVRLKSEIVQIIFLIKDIEDELKNRNLNKKKRAI
ncbi:hypothetical protein QJR26_18530 (plasmid) [Clostridium baratii]